jgi:phosphatidate phosphatase LPIN
MPPPTQNTRRDNLVTKEPFGETEKLADHNGHLGEVDFLDLNASESLPDTTLPRLTAVLNKSPPNPMEAGPGESTDLPPRDYKLQDADDLPKVEPGEANGPDVIYGKDIVLDMSGFHNESQDVSEPQSQQSSMIDALTRDLLAAVNDISRPPLVHSPSDPILSDAPSDVESDSASAFELGSRGFDRGHSEPPPDFERAPRRIGTVGPLSGANSTAVMDYAWDWGKVPRPSAHPDDVDEYALSEGLDLAAGAKLGHIDSYLFTLTASSGRTYAFELGLCGTREFAKNGQTKVRNC